MYKTQKTMSMSCADLDELQAQAGGLPFVPSRPPPAPPSWSSGPPTDASAHDYHNATEAPQRPSVVQSRAGFGDAALFQPEVESTNKNSSVPLRNQERAQAPATSSPWHGEIHSVPKARRASSPALTAKAASDAAIEPAPATSAARRLQAMPAPLDRRAMVELLGFDRTLPRRMRRDARFAPVLGSLAKTRRSLTSVDRGTENAEEAEAREVLGILSVARPDSLAAMRAGNEQALADVDSFTVPVFLASGNLRPTFEPLDALRTLAAVAKPFAGGDKRLAATLAAVDDALAASVLPTSKATQHMATQIEQAMSVLSLPSGYLADAVERTLLEERKYRYRTLCGERRVRCDLELDGTSIPFYAPAEMALRFPLLFTFAVLSLVELRPREDVAETQSDSVFGLAVGRTLKVVAADGYS